MGLCLGIVMLFMNGMLLTSWLFSSLFSTLGLVLLTQKLANLPLPSTQNLRNYYFYRVTRLKLYLFRNNCVLKRYSLSPVILYVVTIISFAYWRLKLWIVSTEQVSRYKVFYAFSFYLAPSHKHLCTLLSSKQRWSCKALIDI